jgi:DivIVA domain-containing protein
MLSPKMILEKDFKVDTRGYRPQEVDKFLDMVMKDYQEFIHIIKELKDENNDLVDDNMALKSEIRKLNTKLDAVANTPKDVSNVDILRRLSNLEKVIYGEDK